MIENQSITLGFHVQSDILDDSCVYGGQPQGTSATYGPFPASPSNAGVYTVTCSNYFGQGTDTLTLQVAQCPTIPFSAYTMDFPTVKGANTPPFGRFDPYTPYVTGEEAYCSGEHWKLKVTSARQTLTIHVNFNGYGDITSNDINSASCSELPTMKADLQHNAARVVGPFQYWYLKDAVWAHEEVHKTRFTSSFQVKYGSFRSTVESIEIPLSAASTPSDALSLLRATNEFIDAADDLDDDKVLAVNIASGHLPEVDFTSPQQAEMLPYINQIDSLLQSCP